MVKDMLIIRQADPVGKNGKPLGDVGGEEHAQSFIKVKDVRVGNSAQTTFAIGGRYQFLRGLHVGVDYSSFRTKLCEIFVPHGKSGCRECD